MCLKNFVNAVEFREDKDYPFRANEVNEIRSYCQHLFKDKDLRLTPGSSSYLEMMKVINYFKKLESVKVS